MSIFQTTRNGLFYTPVYLLAGYLLYDYFNTDLFTKSRGLKYILFLLLLALENVLIYFNQGLDKNFFLLAPLCAVFLFNWSIRTSLFKEYRLSPLKQLSVYYFFLPSPSFYWHSVLLFKINFLSCTPSRKSDFCGDLGINTCLCSTHNKGC